MDNLNLPTMTSSAHSSSSYAGGDLAMGLPTPPHLLVPGYGGIPRSTTTIANRAVVMHQDEDAFVDIKQIKAAQKGLSMRRVVQIFIADPNENIPLDDCLLYRGEEKITDATDQELFFELDIKTLLDAHNARRTKMIDKKVKDRTEFLEPVKVRELKMVVVTVATL